MFDLPTKKGCNLKSMMLFVVYYSSPDSITSEGCQGVLIINYTKATIQAYKRDTLTSFEDEDWQSITSNLEPSNKVEVMIVFEEGFVVERTTVSLLYDEPLDKEMECCYVVDEDDMIVSVYDDKNVCVSSGDIIDVPADNKVIGPGQDKNISEDKHWHAVDNNAVVPGDDSTTANKNFALSGGGAVPADKNVTFYGEDDNMSDNKNGDAVDKDANGSGIEDKNVVSGVDKNVSDNRNIFFHFFFEFFFSLCYDASKI